MKTFACLSLLTFVLSSGVYSGVDPILHGKLIMEGEYVILFSEVDNYAGIKFVYEDYGAVGILWVDVVITANEFVRIKCPFELAYVTVNSVYPIIWDIKNLDQQRERRDIVESRGGTRRDEANHR